jgi:beta-mannosidase
MFATMVLSLITRIKGRAAIRTITLDGIWQCKGTNEEEWIQASVPGSVIRDLYKQGKLENPYWRTNEELAIELGRQDYEYKRSFDLREDFLEHERILLRCEGLDTLAELMLNGSHLTSTDNMHRTYEMDVKPLLRSGTNELHIVFRAPVPYITEQQALRPLWHTNETLPGFPHLRKAHYMLGWDWGPAIPDAGIWRPISLIGMDAARLHDIHIRQQHSSDAVELSIQVELEQVTWGARRALISIAAPDGTLLPLEQVQFTAAEARASLSYLIRSPELWWPNGYGNQPLYSIRVDLYPADSDELLDSRALRIGLRTLTVNRDTDQWGERFAFQVNGVAIFAMGSTYIPEDTILTDNTQEPLERLIQAAVEANFNTIRVRGGGYYPSDRFYDLCDEYGLIVWQEFMFDCAVYAMTPAFAETVRQEFIDNVRRIRHHPSLGLWCGNNEIEWALVDWNVRQDRTYRSDYLRLFEIMIPEVLQALDPDTFYWPSSPSSGGFFLDPNAENAGNTYCWQVWHGPNKYEDYRQWYPRFCTEFGFQSFPDYSTVESFTLPEDRNPVSYVMEKHQKSPNGNSKILSHLSERYLSPKDFDSLIYLSQLLQAEAVKYAVEHWRRHRGRCMGALYFQLNDRWPGVTWSGIDSFGQWKALHYAAKRFFAPVLVSACEEGSRVSLHVTNDTMEKVVGIITWELRDTGTGIHQSGETRVEIDPLSACEVVQLDVTDRLAAERDRRQVYLQYQLIIHDTAVSDGTVWFVKPKHIALQEPRITYDVIDDGDAYTILLQSEALAKHVQLRFLEAYAHFSDNFFDLSPGMQKKVKLKKSDIPGSYSIEEISRGLQIRSLFDASM